MGDRKGKREEEKEEEEQGIFLTWNTDHAYRALTSQCNTKRIFHMFSVNRATQSHAKVSLPIHKEFCIVVS